MICDVPSVRVSVYQYIYLTTSKRYWFTYLKVEEQRLEGNGSEHRVEYPGWEVIGRIPGVQVHTHSVTSRRKVQRDL